MTIVTKSNIVANCSECDSLLVIHSYWMDKGTDALNIKIEPCVVCSNKHITDTSYDDLDDALSEYSDDNFSEIGEKDDMYGN